MLIKVCLTSWKLRCVLACAHLKESEYLSPFWETYKASSRLCNFQPKSCKTLKVLHYLPNYIPFMWVQKAFIQPNSCEVLVPCFFCLMFTFFVASLSCFSLFFFFLKKWTSVVVLVCQSWASWPMHQLM